jgi:cobalt-zinc-cadmium efflux system membrane fusion protein
VRAAHAAIVVNTTIRRLAIVWIVLFIVGLAITVAALLWRPAVSGQPSVRYETAEESSKGGVQQWSSLRYASVLPVAERWTSPYPARIQVDQTLAARVCAPLRGKVGHVLVELGDQIKAGQPLFEVFSLEVAALRAGRDRAALELDVATGVHQKATVLVDAHVLAGKEEVATAARVRRAELSLELATMQLSSLRVGAQGASRYVVTAPRSGVVIAKNVLPSQQVEPGQTLLEVADIETLWVVADVLDADIDRIDKSGPVVVTSPSRPGISMRSQVQMVDAVVDPHRHTVGVRALLSNPARSLRLNTQVEVTLRERAVPNALEIPASALRFDGKNAFVYVRRPSGALARVTVEASKGRGDHVVVVGGLSVADEVVVEGAALLENDIWLRD